MLLFTRRQVDLTYARLRSVCSTRLISNMGKCVCYAACNICFQSAVNILSVYLFIYLFIISIYKKKLYITISDVVGRTVCVCWGRANRTPCPSPSILLSVTINSPVHDHPASCPCPLIPLSVSLCHPKSSCMCPLIPCVPIDPPLGAH